MLIVWGMLALVASWWPVVATHYVIVFGLQGALAALLARWLGMAVWWWLIQLVFPLGIYFALALHIPPGVFLGAFLIFFALYWHTFRTQVPYYPSHRAVWDAIVPLLPTDRSIRLIDIGSGLGGLVLNLAARRPESAIIGVELAPLPWLISWLRGHFKHSSAKFLRADYATLNFSEFDVVFAYLSPAVMTNLWEKSCAEMRPGSLLLSYEFNIDQQSPDLIIQTECMRMPLYAWYI